MVMHTGLLFVGIFAISYACNSRDFGNGATVCVCSKHNCDTLPPIQRLQRSQYEIFTSSKAGARFNRTRQSFSSNSTNANPGSTIVIDRGTKYQKISGFGGAFTDSAGINILSLSNETRKTLMNSYFSENGIQYSMGRIPMGGTDFSTRGYTYDDVDDDFELKFFSLQVEDMQYKIPLILEAMNLTKNNFKLYASAWTAPAWMKTNDRLSGIGFLNLTMYDVWADYYIKFLDAYRQQGIPVWGLTTGNEPANGYTQFFQINDMGWVPLLQAQWIAENLGPKLRTNQYYSNIKIIIIDDQRVYFPWLPRYILSNPVAKQYVDGIGVHYYTDKYVSPEVLTATHVDFPDKFILATEGCEGSLAQQPVILGSWTRAENYLNSILDDLNNWSTGWMDWNMALNLEGGPTYVGNYVDSPIIVNKTADEFYKQPMYYALGHFSKFLPPGSTRLDSVCNNTDIKQVVFERPDGGIVVSLFNPTDEKVPISIIDPADNNRIMNLDLTERSINSVVYYYGK